MRKVFTRFITFLADLGLVPYRETQKNQPCYDKYGRPLGWYSRSVAVALFTFCKDKEGKLYVLGSERGEEAADYRGYWNSTCGYIDFFEDSKEAASREAREECGIYVDPKIMKFVGIEDSPLANRQNITIRYSALIEDKTIDEFTFSKKGNEGKEVGEIKWIPIGDIDNYKWAFNHDLRIKEIFSSMIVVL